MNSYFKGWYFKAQNDTQTVAIIPAMHIDEKGEKSASIQIITDNGVWNIRLPYEQFSCCRNKLRVKIGENIFSDQWLTLNAKTDEVTACGNLKFGPLSPICYDVMGPFRYVPFMECRHSVFSMTNKVSGCLSINGHAYRFDNDAGYIEGDRGRSFPDVYAWTQCNFFDESPCSIMLSVADIPLGAIHFTGIIGVILWHRKEYRIATYLGAKAAHIGNGKIAVSQGRFKLTATLIKKQDNRLYAPVRGGMKRLIRESLSCTASYSFEEDGKTLFDFYTDRASFEYEFEK
jgi:hypothetical protein